MKKQMSAAQIEARKKGGKARWAKYHDKIQRLEELETEEAEDEDLGKYITKIAKDVYKNETTPVNSNSLFRLLPIIIPLAINIFTESGIIEAVTKRMSKKKTQDSDLSAHLNLQ